MIRVLVAGFASSIHVYNYIKNVLSDGNIEVVLYNTTGTIEGVPKRYLDYYSSQTIRIVNGADSKLLQCEGSVRYIKESISIIKGLGKFDYLHLKGITNSVSIIFYLTRKQFSKIIITYWGSDLYRMSRIKRLQTLPLLVRANTITFMSEDMKNYYRRLSWPFRRLLKKSRIIDYGSIIYDSIDRYSNDINNCKAQFGLDSGKIVCSIGYDGRPQMQHLKVIKAIENVIKDRKNELQIVIPAWGIDKSLRQELKNELEEKGIDYKFFDSFMDIEEIARFRLICDIFIHAQTTDALSCSMLEHLYAGSIVINASWLNYSSLNKEQVYYFSFDSFENLGEILNRVLDDIVQEKNNCCLNKEKIARISSWEYLRDEWKNLYK